MSLAERFSKVLKADPGLLAEPAKDRPKGAVEIAAQGDATKTSGKELSDAQLDKVTGGFGSHIES